MIAITYDKESNSVWQHFGRTEYFYLFKNGIKKMQKNISSELLASLETQLIAEDTNDKHSLSQN